MANKKHIKFPELNFVPKDPFYSTFIGKTSVWALKVGRYIIIFTEVIVIMSFASRFKLDRDLTDLTSSIVQKTAVVDSYADTEKQMRVIQKKSDAIAKLLTQNNELNAYYTLINKIPFDVKVSRLGYTPTEIQITGIAQSPLSFSAFLRILQSEPAFKEVSVDQVATSDKRDPGISFTIRLKLRETQAAPLTPQSPTTNTSNTTTVDTGL